MSESWYRKCLPRVSEVKVALLEHIKTLRACNGVKSIKVFGSFAANLDNPNYRLKDIDLLIATPYHSEDLQAIHADLLSTRPEALEEEGYDANAVRFSKAFVRQNDLPIDHWVISSDKKLLHWGPVFEVDESIEIQQEAEKFATNQTGFNLKKLAKASDETRTNWYSSYRSYLSKQTEDMPTGWYLSECQDIKTLLTNAISLD